MTKYDFNKRELELLTNIYDLGNIMRYNNKNILKLSKKLYYIFHYVYNNKLILLINNYNNFNQISPTKYLNCKKKWTVFAYAASLWPMNELKCSFSR